MWGAGAPCTGAGSRSAPAPRCAQRRCRRAEGAALVALPSPVPASLAGAAAAPAPAAPAGSAAAERRPESGGAAAGEAAGRSASAGAAVAARSSDASSLPPARHSA